MEKQPVRIIACALAALLLTSSRSPIGAASQTAQSGESTAFSRSETIARQIDLLPFSGGVIPTTNPPVLPSILQEPPPPFVGHQLASPITQVNTDLVPPPTVQPVQQGEPYLAANPQNPLNLVAVYQVDRFASGGARALNYSASFDGGVTWTEGTLPNLTEATGGLWERATDPWVAFGPNDRVYFASLMFNQSTPDNAIGVSTSTDGGRTWTSPVEVLRSEADFNDKEAVVADSYPDSPYFGNVYAAWDRNKGQGGQFVAQQLLVARSTDGGMTWNKPKKVRRKGVNIGAIPRVGPDGTIYLTWAGGSISPPRLRVFFSKSTDGGDSWSQPVKLGAIRSVGVRHVRAGEILPSFAVNPSSGDLYIAWEDARWTGTDQATLIYSRDRGESWSSPQKVSDGPDDAASFTISVACNPGGEVAVSFYSSRNDPLRNDTLSAPWADEYVTISRNGGVTFEPAERVTPESFPVWRAAWSRGFFLGDYAGLAGTGMTFHLLWVGTNREAIIVEGAPPQQQADVFTAFIH